MSEDYARRVELERERDALRAQLNERKTDNPREILSDSMVKQIARLRADLEAERAWKRANIVIAEQLVDITKELNELKLKYYDAERRLKLKDELIRKLTNEATK